MLLKNPDLERLREEARETYFQYGRMRQRYRANRDNSSLQDQMEKLRARYTELEAALEESGSAPEETIAWQIDLGDLKSLSPKSRPLYNVSDLHDGRSITKRVLAVAGSARVIVSVLLLLIAIGVLLLIGNQNLGFYRVPTSSMEPTLLPNDRLVAYSSESYDRGEVVVVRDPDAPEGYLVKRIVGVSGDVVAVRNGTLIVNGIRIDEPYVKEQITYKLGPVTIRQGEVFLLGDNRNQSHDGHIWKHGLAADSIMGAVKKIYSPRSRMSTRVTYRDVFSRVEPKLRVGNSLEQGAPSS